MSLGGKRIIKQEGRQRRQENPNYAVHLNKIKSIQKQFLIYAMPNEQRSEDRPYNGRYNDMNIQSLVRRRINSGKIFIFNLLQNNTETENLKDYIKIKEPSSHTT